MTDVFALYKFSSFPQSDVTVFRSDDGESEYTQFLKLPKVGICSFMKTIYKKYFYEKIKDYSNLPHYDTCPLEQVTKTITKQFEDEFYKFIFTFTGKILD